MADRAPMDCICDANFSVNPLRLPARLVLQYFKVPFWRLYVSGGPRIGPRRHVFRYPFIAMGMMLLLFAQLLPHQFFAAMGTSRLNETRLSGYPIYRVCRSLCSIAFSRRSIGISPVGQPGVSPV
jgi:hypothetical protein